MPIQTEQKVKCYHCGDDCGASGIQAHDRVFCCDGCKTVFELLSENNLCSYYDLSSRPGISPKILQFKGRFAFLDDPSTQDKILRFKNEEEAHVELDLPQMHCSSCVWLLEHLYRLDSGISLSRTDFLQKKITIEFDLDKTSLRRVVELLASIGYEPMLSLQDLDQQKTVSPQRKRIYRIAVAGFTFSNIMLLSFPEYFHVGSRGDDEMMRVFSYINLGLSIPALVYSGGEFFQSAWQGIKARFLNIDIPLALSILITFGRSLYEIATQTGSGFLDSMTGIIFFMLVGRYFQERTTQNLHFDRNFKSYFPISVSLLDQSGETSIPLNQMKKGDRILVRSQELIPADGELVAGNAWIDYSFVTGESQAIQVKKGECIYAGGRQTSGSIEVLISKEVEQSYLTRLWNKDSFKNSNKSIDTRIDQIAKYFTLFLIVLSIGAFIYWYPTDIQRGLDALTTVLIVACPCALLLSATFTNGSVMRIFSRNKFYLRNASVIYDLSKIKHLVFDKTGTITTNAESAMTFEGRAMGEYELSLIYTLASESNHPLSRLISKQLSFCDKKELDQLTEVKGKGISASVDGHCIKLGSSSFLQSNSKANGSSVFVSIDGLEYGYFQFEQHYRPQLLPLVERLKKRFKVSMISGDNSFEKERLRPLFNGEMHFDQSPEDKLQRIVDWKNKHETVAMIGDGLNDAGALRVSDIGIAISENINNFSPACDAILESASFGKMDKLFQFSRVAGKIILGSFILSLLYNFVGLSYAIQGELAPVVAAILMPLSSISILLFTTGASYFFSKKMGLD